MKVLGVTGANTDGILTTEQLAAWNRRQELSVERIIKHYSEEGFGLPYPMLAAATGYGKGNVIAKIIKRVSEILGQDSPDRTLLIAGTKKMLAEQSASAVAQHIARENDLAGIADTERFAILGKKGASFNEASVLVSIWQGLAALERRNKLPKVGLVAIDEVHNAGVELRLDLLERLEKNAVLGLTATAVRSSGPYRSPESYGFKIADAVPLTEGIENGWNSPLLGLPIDPGYVLPAEVRNGEKLNLEKLAVEMRKHPDYLPNVAQLLAEVFLKGVDGKPGPKAIIPVNRVEEEAVVIGRILRNSGYSVGLAINQAASKKWECEFPTFDAIERHKLPHDDPNSIQVLISPAVITEGYDNPAVELIAWVIPTLSALRYTQVLGRGTRVCQGKAYCLVLDFPWFIEGFGYSTNLAQFFGKDDLHEMEDGRLWLGPKDYIANLGPLVSLGTFGQVLNPLSLRKIDLSGWLTLEGIMSQLGKSTAWVMSRIQELGAEHLGVYSSGNRRGGAGTYYPPALIEQIARIKVGITFNDGSYFTNRQLAKEVGRSTNWVANKLKELGENGIMLTCLANGEVVPHYSPEVLEKLKQVPQLEAAPCGWETSYELAEKFGKAPATIHKGLRDLGFSPTNYNHPECGLVIAYYPPEAIASYASTLARIQDAGDWISIAELEEKSGQREQFINNALRRNGIVGEIRRSKRGKNAIHYPPKVLEYIPKYQNLPEPGDWLNLSDLNRILGISQHRVKTKLKKLGIEGELRREPGKKEYIYYPPDAVKLLK